jgi:hypothetical protein
MDWCRFKQLWQKACHFGVSYIWVNIRLWMRSLCPSFKFNTRTMSSILTERLQYCLRVTLASSEPDLKFNKRQKVQFITLTIWKCRVVFKKVCFLGCASSSFTLRYVILCFISVKRPWPMQLVSGLASHSLGFTARPFRVGFVVENLALGRKLRSFPARVVPPMIRPLPSLYNFSNWYLR